MMEYRRLGSSGLKVSALSIGGWINFNESNDATKNVLAAALERGINFIDLADVYAKGAAERAVGQFLSGRDRSQLILSSKCFWPMSEAITDRGLSRKHIMESVHRSLKNLGTDYLDLYFCHREDPETPLDETVRAMDDLVHQGKILYWGTSCWSPKSLLKTEALTQLRNLYGPVVEQPPYSLLDRHIEKRIMPTARRLGMGLVVWSPLAGGLLTGKYNDGVPTGSRGATTHWLKDQLNETTLAKVRRFCALAQEQGVEPGALALAWILTHSEISSVILGATQPEQVQRNLKALEVKPSSAVVKQIEKIFDN